MKNLFFTFFLSLLACVNHGSCNDSYCNSQNIIEAKAGYFFFSDDTLKKIYDQGGLDVQLCATYPLWDVDNGWTLNAYGAIEYFKRSGRSINLHEKTSIWAVPVNIGLKSTYMMTSDMQYYYSIGPRYLYINQHNDSAYVYKNKSRNGFGFFINTGLNYILCDNFVIDFFGEYSYAKIHFHSNKSHVYTRNIQVGGFTFGGGIGYEF